MTWGEVGEIYIYIYIYMRRFGGGERRYDKRAEQDDEEDMWREMLVNTHELLRDGHRRLREVMSTIAAFREQRAREEEQDEEEGGGSNSQPLERDLSVIYFESKKERLEAHISSLERSRAAIEDAMQYALQEDTNTDDEEFKRRLRHVSYYCNLTQHQALTLMDSDDEEDEDDDQPEVQMRSNDDMPIRENRASPRLGSILPRFIRPRMAVHHSQHSV